MNHRANVFGRGYGDHHRDSARIRFRRAVTMCVLTILVPGTAQMLLGHRWVGRIAFAIWCMLVGAVGYIAVQIKVDRREVLDLITSPDVLQVIRIGVIVLAVLWGALFFDTWRLVSPFQLPLARAAIVTILNIAIVAGAATATVMTTSLVHVQRDVVTTVFHAQKTSDPLHGRYNILLLGSDSGQGRTGIRPDTMMVASIDADSGKTVLIGLPRNLENVPFGKDSPMHEEFPHGFNCGSECLLNAVHTHAHDRNDLYPHSKDPGMAATIDAISATTGLKINYHIVINMKGMRDLVDAVGGVTIDVESEIAMFGQEDAWKDEYIQPGKQKLDGREALWYARSRIQSNDYTRMARQKCLMSAMLQQLSPQRVLIHATEIGESSKALISTDLPSKELGQFADLALKSRHTNIATLSLVPPEVNVADPDFGQIRQAISQAIKKSETQSSSPSPTPSPDDTGDTDDEQSPEDPAPTEANQTDDLESVC